MYVIHFQRINYLNLGKKNLLILHRFPAEKIVNIMMKIMIEMQIAT